MVSYAVLALAVVVALVTRFLHVRKVRYARVNDMLATYAHLVKDPTKMTYKDAEEILKVSQHYDLPLISVLSLSFALFKTYAIPTISSVLCKSRQLAATENVGRRAEDTAIVIAEFVNGGGLDSERGSIALARMNFLHARYGSLISREDKLYTLSTFVFEPAIFSERYEWRALTPLEAEARYVFWREVGARMGITDIPATKGALWDWKVDYEVKHVRYADTNKQVGDSTMALFVRPFPPFLRGVATKAASVFMDDTTLAAFGMPRAPLIYHLVVPALIKLKGYAGHFMLPRTEIPPYAAVEEVVDDKGNKKYLRKGFLWEPWYVDPKASPMGLFAFNRPGDKWHPGGFDPSTIGPERLMDTGVEGVQRAAEEMRAQAVTCPFFH